MAFDPAFFTTPAFFVSIAAAIVAALVRGFTGFGGALIFVPVASAAYGPTVAAPTLVIIDLVLSFPIFVGALRRCRWATVLPTAVAATITIPLGTWALVAVNIVALRWGISVAILLLLALIASGWRLKSSPSVPTSAAIGGLAGFLDGVAQIAGPPVVALWVSGPEPTATIRANLFAFFGLITAASFVTYLVSGLFTPEVVELATAVAPAYGLALFTGAHLFGRTAGAGYRPLAYTIVALAGISSVPALDGLLR